MELLFDRTKEQERGPGRTRRRGGGERARTSHNSGTTPTRVLYNILPDKRGTVVIVIVYPWPGFISSRPLFARGGNQVKTIYSLKNAG
ncbi:hypothetical protein AALK14_11155 [Butyricimonas hominis]|uniref:hypothetical protein n=1 Tax=Butyricimonas TaxID=574697 RepID=UPI003518DCB4